MCRVVGNIQVILLKFDFFIWKVLQVIQIYGIAHKWPSKSNNAKKVNVVMIDARYNNLST